MSDDDKQLNLSDKISIIGLLFTILSSSIIVSAVTGLFSSSLKYVYVVNKNFTYSNYSTISVVNLSNDPINQLKLHIRAPFQKDNYTIFNFTNANVKVSGHNATYTIVS